MNAYVKIPRALRRYCEGRDRVDASGDTITELLAHLVESFPALGDRILDEAGQLQSHLVIIRGDDVLARDALAETRVRAGDELRLYTAVSGG